MSGDLYCLMREALRRLERKPRRDELEPSCPLPDRTDCRCGCPLDSYGRCSCGEYPESCHCGRDPDSMEDDDQPYFWNRSF